MGERMTTAIADCAKHHVAIPANQVKRKSSDWKCPYCKVDELEALKSVDIEFIDKQMELEAENKKLNKWFDDHAWILTMHGIDGFKFITDKEGNSDE